MKKYSYEKKQKIIQEFLISIQSIQNYDMPLGLYVSIMFSFGLGLMFMDFVKYIAIMLKIKEVKA